jgi:cobalt-precorrin-5B (C1)-methyltransferase
MESERKSVKRPLRSGFTTGACAAAAAKAAATALLGLPVGAFVEIPLPGGERVNIKLDGAGLDGEAWASVIKDAGDDPDVTNGARISARARMVDSEGDVLIRGGRGVGTVTRPGLAVRPGEPAINPVPRKMITEAVREALAEAESDRSVEITIEAPEGERLAKKTMNERLGIVGGISILGTTGIVKPLSGEAWRATITAGMDVAKAMGLVEIVLSSGRTSELAHMKKYALPEPSYVMMGDHVEFSLLEAGKREFGAVYVCAQWAKMLKIAMATPDTHVRAGALDIGRALEFLKGLGLDLPGRTYNTAREISDYIKDEKWLYKVCQKAKEYGDEVSRLPVRACLVSYSGDIIAESE